MGLIKRCNIIALDDIKIGVRTSSVQERWFTNLFSNICMQWEFR